MNLPEEEGCRDDAESLEAPEARSVLGYLVYGLSIPERALRTTSAVAGGVLKEGAALLTPNSFRSSKSYKLFVQQMIDFMANDIGGVARDEAEGPSTTQVEGYVARKAVSTFVDLAGIATLHLSPMTILALISDIAYGSSEYLRELSEELKREGVIAKDSTIDSAADLLDAVRDAAGSSAETFDMPPITVQGLQQTIAETREKVTSVDPTQLLPERELQRMWEEMRAAADREHVSMMEVASTISLYSLRQLGVTGWGALTSARVAGHLFDRHILDHYRSGLARISEQGLYATLAEASRPYIRAVWFNFSNERRTWSEELLSGRLLWRLWTQARLGFVSRKQGESKSVQR